MNTFNTIILAYGIYLLTSYIIEAIVLITNSLSRKAIGMIGAILSIAAMPLWKYIGPTHGSTFFYAGAALLSINLILSAINLALGLLSCDGRNY